MFKKAAPGSIVYATVIALILASISAISVFAAGSMQGNGTSNTSNENLAMQWKSELAVLKEAQVTNHTVKRLTAKWLTRKRTYYRRHRARRFTKRANSVLQQAEILATNHPGFDTNGKVIDRVLAAQSLHNLVTDLHKLHLIWRDRLLRQIT